MRPICGCHLVAAKNMLGGLGTRVDLEKALSDGGDEVPPPYGAECGGV